MNPRPQPISGRAIDLGYLSVLVTLTAAGILTAGMEAASPGTGANTPVSVIVLYFIVMECFLLLWALSKAAGRGTPCITCIFTLRMQAQAAVQVYLGVFLTVYLGEWLLLGIAHCLNWMTGQPDAHGLVSPQALSRLNGFLCVFCLLATVWMTTWRLNILDSGGYRFSDVNAGALNTTSIAISAPASVAVKRLEHYLDTLKLDRTPVLPISYYGKRPVVSCHATDNTYIYDLTWAWCPSKIRIALEKNETPVSTVRMTCELRAGYYRAELFTNPHLALALMTYMQTNVLQLLRSELALSASTAKQDSLRNQALEMQLRILQAQIEPHFLFNTLASVRHLYRSSTDAGELMMDHVIAYLRCAMQELRSDVSTVGKEMELILHYLAIMKIRMGERLSYLFIHYDDVADYAFPPAMLISLVENAIKHGLNLRPDGKLSISAGREAQYLRVTVQDNGSGFSSVQGTGVGLSNIRQRLEAIYGNRAWLEVGALANGGFSASIVVPLPDVDSAQTGALA